MEQFPDKKQEEIDEINRNRVGLNFAYVTPYDQATFSNLKQLVSLLHEKLPKTRIILGDCMTDSLDTTLIDLAVLHLFSPESNLKVRSSQLCIEHRSSD